MADVLNAKDWKKLLDDFPGAPETVPLTKALEKYDAVKSKDDFKATLAAIIVVEKCADTALKKNTKTKKLADYVKLVVADGESTRKEIEVKAREAEEREEAAEEGAKLAKRLKAVRLLDRDAAKAFVLALGQPCGLVIAKGNTISAEHKKTARGMRTGNGRLIVGVCYGEGSKYIFQMEEKPAGGLTKAFKKAIELHADLKIKLTLRGPDGDLDDDDDNEELTNFGVDTELIPPAPSSSPAPEEGIKFVQRSKAVKAVLDRLATSNPTLAAPHQTAYDAAVALGKDRDYSGGLAALNEVEAGVRNSLQAAKSARSESEPLPEVRDGDEQKAFDDSFKAVSTDVLIHLRAHPDDRADMTDLLRDAKEAGAAGDFASGHMLLDQIGRIIIAEKRAARTQEMGEQIPEGAGSSGGLDPMRVDVAATTWRQARSSAVQGAVALAAAFRDSPYDDLPPIASLVDDLVEGFPIDLDSTLVELRAAVADGETPRIKQFQARGKKDVRACLDYLKANSNLITACEQHPMSGIDVSIAAPLKQSLVSILDLLK